MADVAKTVEIIFSTTLADGGSALQTLGGGLEDFSRKAQEAVAPLNKLADVVKLTDTAIVALGVAFGGAALQAAGEFNGQVAEIGTLFGGTSEQVNQFRQDILDYASDSTQSIESINGAIYSAISAGVNYADSIEFVSQVEKLAVAGQADLESTTLALVSAMNAYGASAGEAAHFSDVLMQTVLIGQTTMPELAASFSQVTSTAAAAGVSFEDLNAAVAALTAYGVKTPEAMTAIKAAISNIIDPSKEAREAAASLGIQFDANALSSKGLAGVFQEVYEKTNGNIAIITQLFGSMEALKAVTALGSDASGIYAKALEAVANSAGTVDKAFAALEANWNNQLTKMTNSLDIFMITVGTKLNEDGEFAKILGALQEVFKALTFSINAGAFDEVFDTFQVIADRLTAFFQNLAKNLPAALEQVDFSKFNSALLNLADSLGGMFDGIDLSTPEGLADAIQLVVDAIANLINMGAGIAEVWGDAIDGMLPVIQAFADMDQATATSSGKVLGFGDVLNAILPGLASVGSAIQAMGLAAETAGAISFTKFVTGASSLPELLSKIAYGTGTVIGLLGQAGLVGAAGSAGYAVGTVLGGAIDYVVGKLTGGNTLGTWIYELVHGSEDLNATVPVVTKNVTEMADATTAAATPMEEFDASLKAANAAAEATGVTVGGKLVSDLLRSAEAAGEAATKADFLAKAQAAIKEPTEANIAAMNAAAKSYQDTADATGKAAEAAGVVRAEYEKLHPAATAVNDKLKTSAGVMEELASKTDLTNKELLELAKLAKDAEVKLEQIASNERIKNMEMTMKLNIAEVEANAKIAQAAIESIAQTFEADTKLISDLLGQLGDGFSQADKIRIDMATQANERINELHEAQMALIAAQVEYMAAKTAALASGNPIVTIQAGGLQPHLEAFMWEILSQIQIKMAQDGGDLLVGGGGL